MKQIGLLPVFRLATHVWLAAVGVATRLVIATFASCSSGEKELEFTGQAMATPIPLVTARLASEASGLVVTGGSYCTMHSKW